MPRSPDGTDPLLERFDTTERVLHWTVAALVGVLLVSGLVLYVPSWSLAVGHRGLLVGVHIACGFALPLMVIGTFTGGASRQLRADLREADVWTPADRAWWRDRGHRCGGHTGKFNPGQKLAGAFLAGSLAAMVISGFALVFAPALPLSWGTGATFVHDVFTVAVAAFVLGHVGMAFAHPGSLRGITTGRVRLSWARRASPGWAEQVAPASPVTSRPPPPLQG